MILEIFLPQETLSAYFSSSWLLVWILCRDRVHKVNEAAAGGRHLGWRHITFMDLAKSAISKHVTSTISLHDEGMGGNYYAEYMTGDTNERTKESIMLTRV